MRKLFYYTRNDNTLSIHDNTWIAQSFTPDSTFTCTGLTLYLAKVGTPSGILTYLLYNADIFGNPTGTALASAPVDYSGLDTTYPGQQRKCVFSPGVVLTSGVQYVFVAKLSSGNEWNSLRLTYKSVGTLGGGNLKASTNGGSTWVDTVSDVNFDLWDDATLSEMLYQYYYGEGAVQTQTITVATKWLGQTYAIELTNFYADYSVTKIRLYLKRSGDVGTVTLALRNTSVNKPSGSDLITASVDSSAIGTAYGWVEFTFANPYLLLNGSILSFVIHANPVGGGVLSIGSNNESVAGYSVSSLDSGSTWSFISPNYTFLYQMLGEDSVTPYLVGGTVRTQPWGTSIVAPMYHNAVATTVGPGVISTASGNCNGLAISADRTRIFVANGTKIYAYTTAYVLDTAWGTAGVFDFGYQIYHIAVNSSGQILVAHQSIPGTLKIVSLVNAAGSGCIWQSRVDPSVPLDYTWMVAFSKDGSALLGIYDNDGGPFNAHFRLAIADGTTLNSFYSTSDAIKAARCICSNSDGTILYGVYDTSTLLNAVCFQYVPATNTITWTTPLGTRYAHGILMHSNGSVYVICGDAAQGYIRKLDSAGAIIAECLLTEPDWPGAVYELNDGTLLVCNSLGSMEIFDEELSSLQAGSFSSAYFGRAVPLFLSGSAPVITDQSSDTEIDAGETLLLYVTASGTSPLEYQWYKGIDLLVGEENSSYLKIGVTPEDSGTYTCSVTNDFGSVVSAPIVVTVDAIPPTILTQSGDQTIVYLGDLNLYVTASGTPPLEYQWFLDGSLIDDATSSTYSKLSITGSSCGVYTCTVTNDGGEATTEDINITMVPVVLSHTADLNRLVGNACILSVTADGSAVLSYQWYKDDVPISGQIDSNLVFSDLQVTDTGEYRCYVSNSVGTTSAATILTVIAMDPLYTDLVNEIIFEFSMDLQAQIGLDLLDLIPEKFWQYPQQQILQDYVAEASLQFGWWMTQTRDIILLLSPNTTTSVDYLRHLGSILGVVFPPEDTTTELEMRKTLEQAVAWYKVKGTYESLMLLAMIHQFTVNIYDMYTNDYVDFVLVDWWTGQEGTNPPGLDSSYYKSPHFGVEVVLNQIYTVESTQYLWYSSLFGNLIEKVEEVRPVHTVPHFLVRLAPKTDEFGHVVEVLGQIKSRVMGNWVPLTKYFNMVGSFQAWNLNDGTYFNQSGDAFVKTITKWVLGTGASDITDPGFTILNPVLTGSIDPDNITSDNEKYTIEFLVPKTAIQDGLRELGLYVPGSPDQLVVGATFPLINKSDDVEIRVVVQVYKADLT